MTTIVKGIYALIIELGTSRTITIGKRGRISFAAGYYAYVGSALNGLEARIVRHLKEDKQLHWHIDYLLQKAKVIEIIYCVTEKNMECMLSSQLAQKLKHVPHFGCSDCRCTSHLFFSGDQTYLRKTVRDSFHERELLFSAMDVTGIKKALGGAGFIRTRYKGYVQEAYGFERDWCMRVLHEGR
jgi:Uri superfamily endonuclease